MRQGRAIPGRTGLGLLALAAGCASDAANGALGTLANPVRCEGRRGEVAHLGRLRCSDDTVPHFHFRRRGPVGPDGHGLDEFALRCVRQNLESRVHPGAVPDQAPPGFGLTGSSPAGPGPAPPSASGAGLGKGRLAPPGGPLRLDAAVGHAGAFPCVEAESTAACGPAAPGWPRCPSAGAATWPTGC